MTPNCAQCETDLSGQTSSPQRGAEETRNLCCLSRICHCNKCCLFKGRASRSEFWLWILSAALVWLAFSFFVGPRIFDLAIYKRLILILAAIMALPLLSVTIRRYHDVGLPSWSFFAIVLGCFALGFLGAIFNPFGDEINGLLILLEFLWLIVVINLFVFCWPGTQGPNKYGPDPKSRP